MGPYSHRLSEDEKKDNMRISDIIFQEHKNKHTSATLLKVI